MSNNLFKRKNKNKSIDKNENFELNNNVVSTNQIENKKVTIRDLCPEEKMKIGELLKKLAEEKEEKEKFKKIIEDEKKNYESKIDSLIKEKENNSNFNTSINIKLDSFMDNFTPTPQNIENFQISRNNDNDGKNDENPIDIKNLRDKFDKLFITLKKTAQNQEEYFIKYNNTESEDFNSSNRELNSTLSILREEKPLELEYKPTPLEDNINREFIPNRNNFDNFLQLQTSIININDELKENNNQNFFSERSFESQDDIFNSNFNSPKNNMNIISSKKLQSLKEKLNIDDHFARKSNNHNYENKIIKNENSTNINKNKYKEMLNRVREKSQEQSQRLIKSKNEEKEDFYSDLYDDKFNFKNNISSVNNLVVSNNNFEIKSILNNLKPENNFTNTIIPQVLFCSKFDKNKLDEEDDQLISILNSNNSRMDFVNSFRNKNCLKESTVDAKTDFYEDNLFDLIDDIEGFYTRKQQLKNKEIINPMKINYHIEKEINTNMIDIENDIDQIISIERIISPSKNNIKKKINLNENVIKKKQKVNFLEEIQKLNYQY